MTHFDLAVSDLLARCFVCLMHLLGVKQEKYMPNLSLSGFLRVDALRHFGLKKALSVNDIKLEDFVLIAQATSDANIQQRLMTYVSDQQRRAIETILILNQ